jgi:hypothetical protein
MRVAFVPRSTEIKPLFWRFVQQINPPYGFQNVGDSVRTDPRPYPLVPICIGRPLTVLILTRSKIQKVKISSVGDSVRTRPELLGCYISVFICALFSERGGLRSH